METGQLLFTVLSAILLAHVVVPETVHLGVLLPLSMDGYLNLGESLTHVIEPAIQDVYKHGMLSRDYNITFTIKDSACHKTIAVGKTNELQDADAFIGPACSQSCLSAALLASYLNKPMISYSCSSVELSEHQFFPTFARTQPFSRTFLLVTPEILYQAMTFYKWKRAAIISTEDHVWSPIAASMTQLFQSYNISVPFTGIYVPSSKYDHKVLLKQIIGQARVIFLLAFSTELARLLIAANELGMMNGDYAFTTLDFTIEPRWASEPWAGGRSLKNFLSLFDGIVNLAVKKPHGARYQNYTREVNKTLQANNISETPLSILHDRAEVQMLSSSERYSQHEKTFHFAAYLHDAIGLYAVGLNRSVSRGGSKMDGMSIISNITDGRILFTGVSGDVAINHEGNRVPVFVFSNRQNGSWVPIVEIDETNPDNKSITIKDIKTVWPGGTTTVPLDEPKCGFHGEKCVVTEQESINYLWFLLLLILLVLIIALLIGFLYCRKKIFERDLMDTSWIINYKDIVLCRPGSRISSKVKSRAGSFLSSMGAEVNLTNVGRYHGELVALKRLRKDHIDLKREVLVEMKQVRDLIHANVNPYIGMCTVSPNVCIVSIFCSRSSLQDLLANDDIKIDWLFRTSFVNDIAMGMAAIHNSPLIAHGNLKSSNCLIDSRWVCKVSDYGLDTIKANEREDDLGEHAIYRNMFWTAPELLAAPGHKRSQFTKTQKGDVYSYGIILHEILTRDEPYYQALEPKDVVVKVRKRLVPPCRPEISKETEGCDQRYIQLMKSCWDDEPTNRPAFSDVKVKLKAMNTRKNSNIVDNMIQMMEKYTDQLEDLVEERTHQLAIEKSKTEELLYKMLPKPIADILKAGEAVEAESFSSVTIFFSDIVGFTSVASQSTPFQVVNLLNELYTCFDSVIDNHDVYKVETIGDAYMVVSGLPVRNGDRHAGEIATMALNLLSSVKDFHIPHMKHKKVQLRIGIHTGPCVAGVVGIKMPRYCLFGDTVNYASRMESSGLALRIHVSPECKAVLDTLGGYYLEERGPVTLKGKGTIISFFLCGKDGFDKILPDLSEAALLAEHEFK